MNAYAEGKINTFSCILLQKKICYRNYKCELYKLQNEQEILNLRIFGFLALISEKFKTFIVSISLKNEGMHGKIQRYPVKTVLTQKCTLHVNTLYIFDLLKM